MNPVHSRLLPFAIGCSFQGVSPALKTQIQKRLRQEGYRVHTLHNATSKSVLLSLNLIIVFIPSFFFEEDEAFEEKCLGIGRLAPFDQVIGESDPHGPTPGAILETLVQEIALLSNVDVGTASIGGEGEDKRTLVRQEKARKRLERDGFKVVGSLVFEEKGPRELAKPKINDAPLMVMAYQNKREFDLLKRAYDDDEPFFERYEKSASFLYVGRGETPLYALLSLLDHYSPHHLEDALRVLDRRRFPKRPEGTGRR